MRPRDPRTLAPGARTRRDAVCRQSAVRSGTHPRRKHEHAGVGSPPPGGGRLPRVEHQRRAGRPGRQRVHLARVAGWACPRSEVDRRHRPGCDAARPQGKRRLRRPLLRGGHRRRPPVRPDLRRAARRVGGAERRLPERRRGRCRRDRLRHRYRHRHHRAGVRADRHGRHLPVRGQGRGPGDRARRRAGPAQRHRRPPRRAS